MHAVFDALSMQQLSPETFDQALESPDKIIGIFFWGHDCPNCEVAKRSLLADSEMVKSLGFRWYHVNVYDHGELGTRFGLHGIPAFFFFRNQKRLGKISPFPGIDSFINALSELKNRFWSVADFSPPWSSSFSTRLKSQDFPPI